MSYPKITQARLDELKASAKHATLADIGDLKLNEPSEAADAMVVEINAYLAHFAAPQKNEDGSLVEGHPCLVCDMPLVGQLVDLLLHPEAGFEWGLVHGMGHCRNCRWPAAAHHFIKDRNGVELLTMRNVILQIHPDKITLKKTKA